MQLTQKKSAVDLTELAIGIVVLGIVVAIGATILTYVAQSQATCATGYAYVQSTNLCTNIANASITATPANTAYNVSNAAAVGLGTYGNWFSILVIVGIAAVILSLIFMAFGRGGGATGGAVAY